MQDFEVLQYVYALTSMPLQNVQFAFIASSNEENPGIATTMRYLFRDLRFYTSGSAETYAYDGTEDVFVSSEPAVIPVTMNVEAGDESLGSVEGGGTYLRGDSITVSAQPAQGAIFEGWYLRTPEGELASSAARLRDSGPVSPARNSSEPDQGKDSAFRLCASRNQG